MKIILGLLGLVILLSAAGCAVEPVYPAAEVSVGVTWCLDAADSIQQLSMDAAESAVAENADHVAALHIFRHMSDNGFDIRQIGGRLAGTRQILH